MEAGFVALGLVQGSLAALNALGIVLLWRTTRVVNLAQPALGLVGGVLTGMLVSASGWSFWWGAPVGFATGAALGFLSERLVMVRLRGVPRAVPMVATIGLAQLFGALQSGVPFFLGGRLPSYDVDLGFEVFVFPVLLKGPHLLALGTMPVVLIALWRFVHRSRVGTAAVAIGQDIERAQTLGVDVDFARAVSWSVAGALSGVAGVLAVPVLGFSLGDGVAPTVLLLALAPAVLAGLRSLPWTAAVSLAVGVGYQAALVLAPTSGAADLALGAAIVAGAALQRRRLQRDEDASRTSSWQAGTSPPRLPRAVQTDPLWRTLAVVIGLAAVLLAALPPLWLSPSAAVRYGTGAALAMAAVAAAAAWAFAGELSLGHWGLAALGAATVAWLPGPLVLRAIVAVIVTAALGAGLAAVGRQRGGLATAMASLALAVAAPAALLRIGTAQLDTAATTSASVAGALMAAAAVGLAALRSSRTGSRMVAARDHTRRAHGFGVRPGAERARALAISGGLAGLAGVCYLASVPAGLAPGAFDADRSLEVLALAVVGGLGSPVGAAVAAAGLLFAGVVLPSPWDAVATGGGVLWVVLFSPAGLSRMLTTVRDRAAAAVTGWSRTPAPTPALISGNDADPEERPALVAGTDTREVLATPTARAAMIATFLISAPTSAATFGAPMVLRDHLGVDLTSSAAWVVLALAAAGVTAAWWGWKRPMSSGSESVATEAAIVASIACALFALVVAGDAFLVGAALLAAPVLGGGVIGRAARVVRFAVGPPARAAASGVVSAAAVAGLVGAAHLATVAAGGGLLDSARWSILYLGFGAVALGTAFARLPRDHERARLRTEQAGARPTRRRTRVPLRIEGLTVRFGDAVVFDDVHLEVQPGELVALVGGNGTGKSTLLRAAAGFVAPAHGRIDVDGSEATALKPHERATTGLSLVNGARPVFPDLTVRENLRVGAYLTHRTRSAFETATGHVLGLLPALAERLDVRAGLLSGGQQRLLAIAQTLYHRPAVLAADELTLGLDAEAKAMALGALRSLADDGVAVIAVDHDLERLLPSADRIVVLHGGRLTPLDDPIALADVRGDLLPATFLTGATR